MIDRLEGGPYSASGRTPLADSSQRADRLKEDHLMTDAATVKHLTKEQLEEALKIASESDTVEMKLTVPETSYTSTSHALGIDPLEARVRQVVFFDTPDLTLERAGLVVRARRTQDAPDDSTVKVRPVDPAKLPKKLRESEHFGVEVDAMPGGYVCSGSMKGVLTKHDVRAVAFGGMPISKLFDKEQREFYEAHAPAGLALDDLSVLGPINVLKLKFLPEGLEMPLVVEAWIFPNNTSILELSTRCRPAEALEVANRLKTYLAGRNVPLDGEQSTKTKDALTYFSSRLELA